MGHREGQLNQHVRDDEDGIGRRSVDLDAFGLQHLELWRITTWPRSRLLKKYKRLQPPEMASNQVAMWEKTDRVSCVLTDATNRPKGFEVDEGI